MTLNLKSLNKWADTDTCPECHAETEYDKDNGREWCNECGAYTDEIPSKWDLTECEAMNDRPLRRKP